MMTDYDILGVPPNASLAEIRERYDELRVRLHPDRIAGQRRKNGQPDDPAANERPFRETTEAFERLIRERTGGNLPPWAEDLVAQARDVLDAARRLDISGMFGGMQRVAQGVENRVNETVATAVEITETLSAGYEQIKDIGRAGAGLWDLLTGKKKSK
ncbi:J domain-containing protein [Nannocystis pusilla]|uniref:J domain-containing protein n=1 Tax=Nannocystis pusilla TaxID=889268 RepID=UPI003B805EF8